MQQQLIFSLLFLLFPPLNLSLLSRPFPSPFSPLQKKGLPRAYNKDLQEDKEPLFDTVHTVTNCLLITLGVISTMSPVEEKLRAKLVPEMLATVSAVALFVYTFR